MLFKKHLPSIEIPVMSSWQRYLLDSVLAVMGTLSITGIIYAFALYPRIPNISIVYLLIVLTLASTRGPYAAILASVVAFLSFDYFLVPPLYVFTMYRIEEWIALGIFLVAAVLTGQLANLLRQRALEADRRERETRMLYDLVRAANADENLLQQLHTIAQAIITAFSSWGVRECALLLPNNEGTLQAQASAPQALDQKALLPDERALALQVMQDGHVRGLYDTAWAAHTTPGMVTRVVIQSSASGRAARVYLIPLKTGQHIVGVLRLRIQSGLLRMALEEEVTKEQARSNPRLPFFWTFLDQAALLIERARLLRERVHMEVLQRTDALRAALLSSVSHDLRTPLASIKAAASSLQQQDVTWDEPTRLEFARTIEREADRLNRLVGNLLDMSRIEGGALKPQKELYDFADLVHDVLERMQPLLQGRAVQLDLPKTLALVEIDYVMMDQVLTNLLENAVRYTPVGSPLDIRLQREGEHVILRLADRGPGIPRADLERVFDKFYRVKQPQKATPGGTGLGLAVSRGIVEAHGGRIWAAPQEGGGVAFSLALPVSVHEGMPV